MADRDLVTVRGLDDARALDDAVDTKDGDVREVDDWRGEGAADVASVRDGEGRTTELVRLDLPVPGALGEIGRASCRERV